MIDKKLKKAVLHPLRTLGIINRRYFQLFNKNSDPDLKYMKGWIYGSLPKASLKSVFPTIADASFHLKNAYDRTHNMSVTVGELCSVLAIMKHINARRVLEIGTFDGGTTLNLAANLPADGKVYTVDLPVEETCEMSLPISGFNDNRSETKIVGRQFKNRPEAEKVEQIFKDSALLTSADIDSELLDFVFIDGCHDREYVQKDSEFALKNTRKGGVIVWHDYGMIKDVSATLDNLALKHDLIALSGGRLVICQLK